MDRSTFFGPYGPGPYAQKRSCARTTYQTHSAPENGAVSIPCRPATARAETPLGRVRPGAATSPTRSMQVFGRAFRTVRRVRMLSTLRAAATRPAWTVAPSNVRNTYTSPPQEAWRAPSVAKLPDVFGTVNAIALVVILGIISTGAMVLVAKLS